MVARSQSLRPSAYLGANCRPSMPGRSLSGLSTMSIASSASQQSDDAPDEPSTYPTTPSRPSTSIEEPLSEDKVESASKGAVVSAPASRASLSRPIAIQVPPLKKFSSAPDCTPPEPLSARGDLIGGYFPMHEDPSVRVRQTHPFQQSAATGRADQSRVYSTSAVGSFANPGPFMPSSYASGPHDHLMASGKYYPTNYERRRSRQKLSESSAAAVAPSPSSSFISPSAFERNMKSGGHQKDPQLARSESLHSTSAPPGENDPLANPNPRQQQAETVSLPSTTTTTTSSSSAAAAAASHESDERKRQQILQYQQDIIAQTAKALRRTANDISQPAAGSMRVAAMASPHAANMASHQGLDQPRRGALAHRAISNDESRSRHPASAAGTLERLAELSLYDPPASFAARPAVTQATPSSAARRQAARVTVSAAAGHRGLADPSMLLNTRLMPPKPISPRLMPMGSPGPVTPMDLDPAAAPGGILGRGAANAEMLRRARLQL
ncbi:hypothetical protein ESCO_000090 [Escovopsis weberi]|uniref:Uncharacterized protein n=1 Tax=Escovopsis weberi TaxID=150374 RepID=A0A0M8N357_ESCWE|nr:hypothetical protein ESCO_000090 [Escovopsis weberi]